MLDSLKKSINILVVNTHPFISEFKVKVYDDEKKLTITYYIKKDSDIRLADFYISNYLDFVEIKNTTRLVFDMTGTDEMYHTFMIYFEEDKSVSD